MADPKIAAKAPLVKDMEPGTYHYCTCGHTANQPFCDGTHKTLDISRSQLVEVKEKETIAFCMCRHSGNKPRCDGSHKKL